MSLGEIFGILGRELAEHQTNDATLLVFVGIGVLTILFALILNGEI